ncbi:biopolymer transporter ExbD [Aurantimonas sp. 22II-16-19i]|uniref:ExbD/TolR family protein n=1 Tax=Aurantimonas sp. 22II-16-19i TaxID=1317114 RepID=UPI0009F7CD29|nr:biopolymer transporter ExbD [Aurantimonas sp. 22II-16-19i]ORE94945.1 tolR or exbD [Aurantimonas sp. 22II-16-19i]
MLTPLVDVIFLLVIFFALSSRIAPFVVIPVAGGGEMAADRPQEPGPGRQTEYEAAADHAVLILSRGQVRIGRRTVPLGDLAAAAAALRAEGVASARLLPSRGAVAEDVAKALAALRRAGIAEVRLLARPMDGPATAVGRNEARP